MSKKKATIAPVTSAEIASNAAKMIGMVNHEDTTAMAFNCGVVEVYMGAQFSGKETREELVSKLSQLQVGDENYNAGADNLIGTTVCNNDKQKAISAMLMKFGIMPVASFANPEGALTHLWVLFSKPYVKPKAKKKVAKKKSK